VLAKKVDPASVGAPKPAVDLKPGTYHYQIQIDANGQHVSLKVSTTIQETATSVTVTDVTEMPQGTATDIATLDKTSLVLEKRSVKQGPMSIDIDFTGNKAAGKMSMNGQERPIAADLGGPIFGDAAGGDMAIGCLPLADGYTATIRNFDIQTQKVKFLQLTVAGTESVKVPAGTFDAYRVEVSAAEGGSDKKTIWVAKDSHQVVKVKAVMASMGGAVMTQELAGE